MAGMVSKGLDTTGTLTDANPKAKAAPKLVRNVHTHTCRNCVALVASLVAAVHCSFLKSITSLPVDR